MKNKRIPRGTLIALVVVLSTGCVSGKRDLSARDYWPSGARWKQSTMQALKTSFRALAWGTAWARVEGGRHYPSDVLFGAALGNFVAIFVRNAFLPANPKTRITAVISRREVSFLVALSF